MEQDQQLEHSHLYDSGNHSGSVIKPLPIYSYPYFLYIGNDEDNKLDEIRIYVNIGLFKYKKEINFIEFYLNNLQSILQSTLQQFSLQNNLQQSSLQNEIFEKAIEILKIYLNKLKENETIFKLIEKVNNKEITKETNEIANNLIKIAPNSVVAWFYYSFYYGFEYSINLTTVDPDKAEHAIESFEMTTLSKCSYPLIEIYKPLIYENIGMIYENLDLPDKAVIYYDKCCELSFEYTTFWANNTRALMNLYRGEYLLAYNDLITILDECILKTNVKDIDIYYVCNLITDILTCIDEIEWSLNRNNDDLEDDNDKKKLKYSRQEVINILERFGASNFSLKACFFKLGEREINAEIFLKEVQRCIYVDTDELVQFGNSLYDILVEDLGSEEIVNKNYYYLFHPIQKRTG